MTRERAVFWLYFKEGQRPRKVSEARWRAIVRHITREYLRNEDVLVVLSRVKINL